jgi:hypothetical protein
MLFESIRSKASEKASERHAWLKSIDNNWDQGLGNKLVSRQPLAPLDDPELATHLREERDKKLSIERDDDGKTVEKEDTDGSSS